MAKKTLVLFFQIILIIVLAFFARESWRTYQEEKINEVFLEEAVPVSVQVDRVSQEKRLWKDHIGNSKYLYFNYKQKTYNIRYTQDSAWVGAGSTVQLLYDPKLDDFRQYAAVHHAAPTFRKSKLLNWSALGLISFSSRWLFIFCITIAILILLASSILANLTKSNLLDLIRSTIINLLLVSAVLYVSYDTFSNYRYWQQLKHNGQLVERKVVDKTRNIYGHDDGNSITNLYYYTATVDDAGGEMHIPITKAQYEQIQKGNTMPVLYNAQLDDMMSADYTIEYWKWFFVGIVWLLLLYRVVKVYRKRKQA